MAKLTYDVVREFLKPYVGKKISLKELREELKITREDQAFDEIRNILFHLCETGDIRTTSQRGIYKVIKRAVPVPVFSIQRERRPEVTLKFPRDRDTGLELPIAGKAVIREGDLILISGVSNYGKTTIAMNFLGENIDSKPV